MWTAYVSKEHVFINSHTPKVFRLLEPKELNESDIFLEEKHITSDCTAASCRYRHYKICYVATDKFNLTDYRDDNQTWREELVIKDKHSYHCGHVLLFVADTGTIKNTAKGLSLFFIVNSLQIESCIEKLLFYHDCKNCLSTLQFFGRV